LEEHLQKLQQENKQLIANFQELKQQSEVTYLFR
jgi:hypothetical protein